MATLALRRRYQTLIGPTSPGPSVTLVFTSPGPHATSLSGRTTTESASGVAITGYARAQASGRSFAYAAGQDASVGGHVTEPPSLLPWSLHPLNLLTS